MLRIGSLFSGIGGLELGLEWAGLGPVVWQVEKDPFCRLVLAKHWPDAERFDDVCSVGANELPPVDLICGGFPCQDVSSAGRGAGLAGERSGLWREFARIVTELHPGWVVVENVTSGASRWLDAVVGELEQLEYACLPVPLSASDLGAPHQRARLFIVANAPDASGVAPGSDPRSARDEAPDHDADAHSSRRQGSWTDTHEGGLGPATGSCGSPQPGVVPLVHGLSGGLAGRQRRARIRALGNSVVPQCAEVVGWVIRELMAEQARSATR